MSILTDTSRGIADSVLDFFGINDAFIRAAKNTKQYKTIISNLQKLSDDIDKGNLTITDLRNSRLVENPASEAYRVITQALNQAKNKVAKDSQTYSNMANKVRHFDTSDLFEGPFSKVSRLKNEFEDRMKGDKNV